MQGYRNIEIKIEIEMEKEIEIEIEIAIETGVEGYEVSLFSWLPACRICIQGWMGSCLQDLLREYLADLLQLPLVLTGTLLPAPHLFLQYRGLCRGKAQRPAASAQGGQGRTMGPVRGGGAQHALGS